ncbi:pentapeptide repeat-containing protein [Amycolatopsis sp. NPDC003731]
MNVICAYLRMPFTPPDEQLPPADDERQLEKHQRRAQEREVRLAARRILREHLQPGVRRTFWKEIDLDLTNAHLIVFSLQECRVRTAGFSGATFTGTTRFDRATFTAGARFDGATFTGEANFGRATFTDEASFDGATFKHYAGFGDATFTSAAWFRRATFTGIAQFRDATFTGPAEFEHATFPGDVGFARATFNDRTSGLPDDAASSG